MSRLGSSRVTHEGANTLWPASVVASGLVIALAVSSGGAAFAQTIDENLWITAGQVNAVARDGNTIYVGGNFNRVMPASGSGVPLDVTTGGLPASFPKVAGQVFAIVSDGAGGWYIGGRFTAVGGRPRSNLAHVASDLSVTAWDPAPTSDQEVRSLARSGSTVYVGGAFTSIGGQPRNRIAAVDATTGAATAWNPGANGGVYAIAVSGPTIYAAGVFTSIGGQPRNRIAALDATTGAATAWNPDADNGLSALAVSGSTVYAAGSFNSIGGQTRHRIAALDATTGAATAWDPDASSNVVALAVNGSTVYAGGQFTAIGGQPRNYVAALDATTGAATAWNPNANAPVFTLATAGSTVYVGGAFLSVGGQSRNFMAALDATTGNATAWNPDPNNTVTALAVSGSTVFAGGTFQGFGGLIRNSIAAFDATTGAPTSWNPGNSGEIHSIVVSGSVVYVGGDFTVIGSQPRNRIAAFDATTGNLTAWSPSADGTVRALAVGGATVYVGGNFSFIGGQTRIDIAALDAASGAATGWNPGANGTVMALAVDGSTVYAGGDFTIVDGQTRVRIAALDAISGAATAWNPDANGTVRAIAVSGATVFAGGSFSSIGGQARDWIAALDALGSATAWNPDANGDVYALVASGPLVYAGGSFGTIGGQTRMDIAAIDAATGSATAWNPDANATVFALAVTGSSVCAGGSFFNVGGRPQASLAAIGTAISPTVVAVQPASGGDAGAVTLTVSGSRMLSGATARLQRSGQPDIEGSAVTIAPDGSSLSATFDLTGAALGAWDVLVENLDLTSGTLFDGFTIESSAPFEIRVNVLGPTQIRANRRKAFDVVLENLGNGDALDVPLWVSGIPVNATVELDFPLASPPQGGGEPDWSTVPLTLDGPGGKYLALVIPRLPPGPSVRRIYLTVPNPVTSFTLDAALTPPWADRDAFRACLSSGGGITAPACMGSQLAAIHDYLTATPAVQALSGIGLWAKIAWQCEGAATLPAALVKAEQVLDFMLQPVEGTSVPAGCEVSLVPRWQDRRLIVIVTSVDPNDKLGAGGVGPGKLIGNDQLLPYSIRFENQPTATAPAQEVVVYDALDVATLDVHTVSLGPITFGSRSVYPPPGLDSYTTDVDLRPAQDLIVRVGVNLDLGTGILSWSLTSIDPATGTPPEDPQAGFLPPNLTPPQGEGSVLFTVMPKPGLAGGTSIHNRATIDFDGTPLLTPEWANLLDTTPPASAVLPLGATQDSASFTVRWAASGPPPDLRDYSVYVSENGGVYRPWRAHTTATADTIRAPGGGTYAFYSLARDSSGNLESVPATPDVQTFSRVAVESGARPRLALEGAVPNPASGEARVWFTLPSHERAALEVLDVAGRRVLRREVGQLGPGRHSVELSGSAWRPGLYFLTLAQGAHSLRARLVVLR